MRTWQIFWWAAGAVSLCLFILCYAAATSTFLYRHPMAPDVRVVIDNRTGAAVVAALADPASGIKQIKPEPRARAPRRDYNFGLMDPGIMGSKHDFTIENVGNDVLELKLGGTTCKCTMSGISDNRVKPGKSATVTLEWNTGKYNPHFSQSATIRTNDPLCREIEFKIEGQIRALVTTDQNELVLPPAHPGSISRGETLLYSQTWKDFDVVDVSGQLPGLTWTTEPVEGISAELTATAAKRVKFGFETPGKAGGYDEEVRIGVRSRDGDQTLHYVFVSVHGKALRRLAFYGAAIDESGMIDLGSIQEGEGRRVKLLAKVRDEVRTIEQPQVEVFPSFLKADFKAHVGDADGLYDLTIELPEGTPPCQYLTSPIGRIRIDTGHPRIGVVELMVSFMVAPRPSLLAGSQ